MVIKARTIADSGFGSIEAGYGINIDIIDGKYVISTKNQTGWASYTDTQYSSGSPFTVLANTPTILPNNAGNVRDTQKPPYIPTYYDGTGVLGRNGDGLDIMIYFTAIPSIANQNIDVWIDIGDLTPIVLYFETKDFPKGAGEIRGIKYSLPSAYTLDTWEANKGKVYIESNANLDVYGMVFNFDTSHRAV